MCVVVPEIELEENLKIIPLLVLFFGWQIPVHRSVYRAQLQGVQIIRVTFSGDPFVTIEFNYPS